MAAKAILFGAVTGALMFLGRSIVPEATSPWEIGLIGGIAGGISFLICRSLGLFPQLDEAGNEK